MKTIERVIFPFQEVDFFTPIRSKIEYAKIVVLGAKTLLLNSQNEGIATTSKMKLIVDKMSRLFFYKDKKYFSISFPFTVLTHGVEVLELTSYSGKKLDYKGISDIISILKSKEFNIAHSLIDVSTDPDSFDSSGLSLLEEIFLVEPSYIRYDHDPKNVKGKLHPLHHLDINYSPNSTFKLGLKNNISENHFENIQNINTDCSFLID